MTRVEGPRSRRRLQHVNYYRILVVVGRDTSLWWLEEILQASSVEVVIKSVLSYTKYGAVDKKINTSRGTFVKKLDDSTASSPGSTVLSTALLFGD